MTANINVHVWQLCAPELTLRWIFKCYSLAIYMYVYQVNLWYAVALMVTSFPRGANLYRLYPQPRFSGAYVVHSHFAFLTTFTFPTVVHRLRASLVTLWQTAICSGPCRGYNPSFTMRHTQEGYCSLTMCASCNQCSADYDGQSSATIRVKSHMFQSFLESVWHHVLSKAHAAHTPTS